MTNEARPAQRPARLLTQNTRLKKISVWNWTLPAWAGRFPDGRTYNTCPSAGICGKLCYARNGAYRYSNVRAKHEANLLFVLDDPDGFEEAMKHELDHPRFNGTYVRVHDAGDFFSDGYTLRWLRIMRERPHTQFYCYTKEVDRFRRLVIPDPPPNFKWCFSYGGTQDDDLDPTVDRVADVFPTEEDIAKAGFHTQAGDDRLAVLGPAPVGMSANRIPHILKKIGGLRFSDLQRAANKERDARRKRRNSQPE